jgi:hypothetical protein
MMHCPRPIFVWFSLLCLPWFFANCRAAWECELGAQFKAPLILAGKSVGTVSIPAGSKVTLLKPEGDGFLVKREKGDPFHVTCADIKPMEGIDLHEIAIELGGAGCNPTVAISVDRPILLAERDLPVEATLTATIRNFPQNAALKYSWEEVQEVLSPFAAKVGRAFRSKGLL